MARSLRPARADDLGLRRALSDRLLPLLVAAMVFLAALALGGATAASGLARHWRTGAAATMMVQVPQPEAKGPEDAAHGATRLDLVTRALHAAPGVAAARLLPPAEVAALLKPWLGQDPGQLSLPLPALFEVRLVAPDSDTSALAASLANLAPGTLVERNGAWLERLAALVRSLQACATLALCVVGFVATAVVAVATRAGLAARRDAIEIVHGLGATDGMIAGQFARRVTVLALAGAVLGLTLAVPVLLGLANLAAPFLPQAPDARQAPGALLAVLPPDLWLGLAALPAVAAAIGWMTAQGTVRGWLGRLA